MPRSRSYSDADLRAAVAGSHSWRGVLRQLGLAATSSAAIRSIRLHADALSLDHGHFRGQRTWSEEQLRAAVADAGTWQDVADSLSLSGGSGLTTIKGHVTRLGISAEHLSTARPRPSGSGVAARPSLAHLPAAGSLLAAAWFALCGDHVSWPLEPCRYDLLVEREGTITRVQVKTTTVRTGHSWTVWLSTTRGGRTTYDIEEIDAFFVIDGDLNYYLIPIVRAGGLHAIQLSAYREFLLTSVSGHFPGTVESGTARPSYG